jgi:uncharacterized delta-60 repeat protein
MVESGKGRNKHTGALLLLLFILGLVCLALPAAAESGVATAWVRSYNAGVESGQHGSTYPGEATAMAVDGQGNVFVAGSNGYVTLKYGPDGQRLWGRRIKYRGIPQAMALDSQGSIHVAGRAGSVNSIGSWYATIKYNPNGQRLWGRFYVGPPTPYTPNRDAARAMAVDGQGNVLVTGESSAPATGPDFLTIKYGPEGRRLWLRRYDGGNEWGRGSSDKATAIAVDGQGNVYVTGSSYGGYYHSDIFTLKYSPEGQFLWMSRYNGPGDTDDAARAVALDSQGNVYVTGRSTAPDGQSGGYDFLTIKYSPDGEERWTRRYNGPGNDSDDPVAIAVDGKDNVYVTGRSQALADDWYSNDYATVKYSPDGEELWVRRYNGPANGDDYVQAMALDAQGNVYLTGESCSNANSEYATIKYNPEGELLWVMRYGGQENQYISPSAISVDGQGQVYVTGTSMKKTSRYGYLIDSNSYYVTIKYLQTPRNGR